MFEKTCAAFTAALLLIWIDPTSASGRRPPPPTPTPTPPPAPDLDIPVNGASLIQPINLSWNAPPSTVGPIGSYTWQVSTSSTFSTVITSGFTNQEADPAIPIRTSDKVSGLANGTYFWRVKASEATVNGGVDSAWSTPRSFVVTGPGPAPATPTFITPANNAQFHVRESFNIQWSSVVNAQYYLLEAGDEPTCSYPMNLTLSPISFVTESGALWGDPLAISLRSRAVPG